MATNPDFISPCGLYCGVCAIYIAHRDNNRNGGMYLTQVATTCSGLGYGGLSQIVVGV
jgi:hypothetical protein